MNHQIGSSLLEVLITIVLLAFGMLGVAGLQVRTSTMEMESYQRSQALGLVNDMASRLQSATLANPASYVTTTPMGSSSDGEPTDCSGIAAVAAHDLAARDLCVGHSSDGEPTDCSGITAVAAHDLAAHDLCEWSNALKGASEKKGSSNVGAMIGALGCVREVHPMVTTPGACKGGLYEVIVVWQGLVDTTAPSNACGQGTFPSDKARRSVSMLVGVGTAGCV